jgi:hypothetical protein
MTKDKADKKKLVLEPELTKKEEKKIRKMRAKITYHEARGGNRQGKIGDKRGEWSENPEWDEVQFLKKQIDEIMENMQQRAWGKGEAKKCLGGGMIHSTLHSSKKTTEDKIAAEQAKGKASVESSPVSVIFGGEIQFPPTLALNEH